LYLSGAQTRVDGRPKGGSFQDAHRHTELRPVPKIENLNAQLQSLFIPEFEILHQRQVSLMQAARPKSIPPNPPVISEWRY
jgi:hypothetical protein